MMDQYVVRTIYLANFYEAAASMVKQRHNLTDTEKLIGAMKRVELADKTLEEELNRIVSQGYEFVTAIEHPPTDYKDDLLITAIFERSTK